MSKKVYVTLTGTKFYHGKDFLKEGMRLELVKEPDNEYDKEAILVRLPELGKLGYVANSVHTVIGECISAGRLYDRIGKKANAEVVYILPTGVILKVSKKDLKH